MRNWSVRGLAALLVLAMALPAAADRTFTAHLSGAEEVPPVDTRATGQAIFRLSLDGMEMHYKLIVANIQDVRASHIHMAPAGQNGGVVVTLFGGPTTSGRTNGVLAEGTITDADVSGGTLADLVNTITNGGAYVNVHTSATPSGEIRGQIR